jgi:hypothetical protein
MLPRVLFPIHHRPPPPSPANRGYRTGAGQKNGIKALLVNEPIHVDIDAVLSFLMSLLGISLVGFDGFK